VLVQESHLIVYIIDEPNRDINRKYDIYYFFSSLTLINNKLSARAIIPKLNVTIITIIPTAIARPPVENNLIINIKPLEKK